jgi:hypothetical protein
MRSSDQIEIAFPTHVFKLYQTGQGDLFYYFRIQSYSAIIIRPKIWALGDFQHYAANHLIFFSMVYGILLSMAIYNLFVYLILKDKTYLYYVAYVTSSLFYTMVYIGHWDLVIGLPPGWAKPFLWISICMIGLTAILFSKQFLSTKKYTPTWDTILNGLIFLGLAQLCLIFLDQYRILNYFNKFYILIGPVCVIWIAIQRHRQGYRPARFFIAAWGLLVASSVFMAFIPFLSYSILNKHAMPFAMAVETLLLAFALADRVKNLRTAKLTLEKREKKLIKLSVSDSLTGLYNKRYLLSQLTSSIEHAHRMEMILSVIFIDVDDFKAYNDTYGHPEGDKVLVVLGEVLQEQIRESDIPCRYGGEEFTILLPQTKLNKASEIVVSG